MKIQAANPEWRAILEAAAQGDLLFLQEAYYNNNSKTAAARTQQHEHDDAADADNTPPDNEPNLLLFETASCSSGCFALHWVAGSCACPKRARRVLCFLINECGVDVNQPCKTKSLGRTAMHYACRNGRLETARVLVHEFGANANAAAKSGVTPFQLACWRNELPIAMWLVKDCHVDSRQTNDFDCNALHWLALCPAATTGNDDNNDTTTSTNSDDDRDLVPTATWLVEQCGIDCRAAQRQGHNALHKAAWGGHLALCRYLHEVQNMWDDQPDGAGYYAADLAEMAHKTKVPAASAAASKKNCRNGPADDNIHSSSNKKASRHAQVAMYLRRVCSRATLQSCRVLNIALEQAKHSNPTAGENDVATRARVIRRAYHEAVRRCHPDKRRARRQHHEVDQQSSSASNARTTTSSTASHIGEATISMTENPCYSAEGGIESPAWNEDRFLQVTAAYRHLMHMDEQDEHDNRRNGEVDDNTNDDAGGDNGVGVSAVVAGDNGGSGGNSRRCYCNQKAIPFLLPPSTTSSQSSPALAAFFETVAEAKNDVNHDPHGSLATNAATARPSCTSSADDEAWLTQSRLRIVLQQYSRCGSRGDDDDTGGGGVGDETGTNATTTTFTTTTTAGGVVEEQQGGLDLSNLRKWWNRCWPDVSPPVTNNKRNLKAWIKTQHAVVYMRRDDKGVIRLYIKERYRGRQQQQQQGQGQ